MEPTTDETVFSLVEVTFEEVTEGTVVTVTQTRIATPEERDMHLQGWVGCMARLDSLLGT